MHALDHSCIRDKYIILAPFLNEKSRRIWAAIEAQALGYGGISALAKATGLSRNTIKLGRKEVASSTHGEGLSKDVRIRGSGAGRKKISQIDPTVVQDLEKLTEPYSRGDPMSPLRWTCKSTTNLSVELKRMGHQISAQSVARLLKEQGYSLQSNRKRFEGKQHPDRNAQFEYINKMVGEFQNRGSPVISVDAKKKELIGAFKNVGKEWAKKGEAPEVNVYDFVDPDKGKALPYGIYDQTLNKGWVNVGVDHDTAEFAVESIRQWWAQMGEYMYFEANELLILADGGGSNSCRNRLWKYCLQELADENEMKIVVNHFPPGTSKWNKIEHRMFSHITKNWRGKPLESHEVIVNLIGSTRTKKGLEIKAQLDERNYEKGRKISDETMNQLNIERAEFHGEWNYLIAPRK